MFWDVSEQSKPLNVEKGDKAWKTVLAAISREPVFRVIHAKNVGMKVKPVFPTMQIF